MLLVLFQLLINQVDFSIFQMLEHCPPSELVKSKLWKAANKLISYKGANTLTVMEAQASKKAVDQENEDVFVGCYCYLSVLKLNLSKRYDSPLYAAIYKIRQGRFYSNTSSTSSDRISSSQRSST